MAAGTYPQANAIVDNTSAKPKQQTLFSLNYGVTRFERPMKRA